MVAIVIGIIVIMAALALFAYFSFSPKYVEPKALAAFNQASIIIIVFLTALFYINGRMMLPLSETLREIMSLIFAFCFELVLIVLFFIARNFWIFKPPRR